MTSLCASPTWRGKQYALVLGRGVYDTHLVNGRPAGPLCLGPLTGVLPTVRRVAVYLARIGYSVVAVADDEMIPDSDKDTELSRDALRFADQGRIQWIQKPTKRITIRTAIKSLAAAFPNAPPAPIDEMIVYICGHGLDPSRSTDRAYGVALADVEPPEHSDDDQYNHLYSIEMLKNDLAVGDTHDRWGTTLVILDTCHSASAFQSVMSAAPTVSRYGMFADDDAQGFYTTRSYHCLAAAPALEPAFCWPDGTLLHDALHRVWWNLSTSLESVFRRDGGELVEWATSNSVANRVNAAFDTIIAEYKQKHPDEDLDYYRQACAHHRLLWPNDTSVGNGEFVVFNHVALPAPPSAVPSVPGIYSHAAALIVAVSRYQSSENSALADFTDLRGVRSSARHLSRLWNDRGFKVESVVDFHKGDWVTKGKIIGAARKLATHATERGGGLDSLLIVHLIGHGAENGDAGLLLSDAWVRPDGSLTHLSSRGLYHILEDEVGWVGCNILLMCDCGNGGGMFRPQDDLAMSESEFTKGYARRLIASCLRGTSSYTRSDNTNFTEKLLDALGADCSIFREGEEFVGVAELCRRLNRLDPCSPQKATVGRIWDDWSGGMPNTGDIRIYRNGSGVA